MKEQSLGMLIALVGLAASAFGTDGANTLWYRQWAERWTEAVPIGNGRLGPIIYGGSTSNGCR